MPHNLYLHSALVQTRGVGRSVEEQRAACKFNLDRSRSSALNGALIAQRSVPDSDSCCLLLLEGGTIAWAEIEQAHELLAPLLGTTMASVLFAVALLASGRSSTLTGTYAGQIVMEGFLNIRLRPWLRRLLTRSVAIVPAGDRCLLVGTVWHIPDADPQSGDLKFAVALRRAPIDPFHQ